MDSFSNHELKYFDKKTPKTTKTNDATFQTLSIIKNLDKYVKNDYYVDGVDGVDGVDDSAMLRRINLGLCPRVRSWW